MRIGKIAEIRIDELCTEVSARWLYRSTAIAYALVVDDTIGHGEMLTLAAQVRQ